MDAWARPSAEGSALPTPTPTAPRASYENRAVIFATAMAWHDSPALWLANLICVLGALGLAVGLFRTGGLRLAGTMDYVEGIVHAALSTMAGIIPLATSDIRWGEVSRGRWSTHVGPVVRGVLIAVPLLLVFGGLFMAADAVFEGLVTGLFRWDFQQVLTHVGLIVLVTWIVAGCLGQAFLGKDNKETLRSLAGPMTVDAAPQAATSKPASVSLSIVEMAIVLGTLDLLFLAFVAVQFRYFFGGAAFVAASATVTHSEYARRGFFELVAVAALVLPLLLVADWALQKGNRTHQHIFRALAATLVLLLFVVMASAVQRMLLYQSEFGLTELRLYTTAFMGWLAIVFVWLLATVLRGLRNRFAVGGLIAGFVVVAALNVTSPDALIIRTNLGRMNDGRPFDASYAASLSLDAVPALVEALPSMSASDRQTAARLILKRWPVLPQRDWRTLNWGRLQGEQVLSASKADIERLAYP